MIYDRKQLAELLNTTKDNIKKLEKRNKLDEKLTSIRLKLNKIEKVKSKTYYNVEEIPEIESIKYNIIKYVFEIKENDKFEKYFVKRTDNIKEPITLELLSNHCNTSRKTISKWDNKMVDKQIISKDGFFYMYKDNITNEEYQISKEEYKNYWRDKAYLNELSNLQDRYYKGEINLTQFQILSIEVSNLKNAISKGYAYKVKRFKLNDDSVLYQDMSNLIKEKINCE